MEFLGRTKMKTHHWSPPPDLFAERARRFISLSEFANPIPAEELMIGEIDLLLTNEMR
jgi:hypothetical protein